MAMTKSAHVKKTTKKAAPKKAASASAPSSAATKKAAPKKAAGTSASASAALGAAAKKAAPKKAAVPKLSDPQKALLVKIAGHADPLGYHAEKKPENKTLEALLRQKLVKRGKKHASGDYHYHISNAGKKFLATTEAKAD